MENHKDLNKLGNHLVWSHTHYARNRLGNERMKDFHRLDHNWSNPSEMKERMEGWESAKSWVTLIGKKGTWEKYYYYKDLQYMEDSSPETAEFLFGFKAYLLSLG